MKVSKYSNVSRSNDSEQRYVRFRACYLKKMYSSIKRVVWSTRLSLKGGIVLLVDMIARLGTRREI